MVHNSGQDRSGFRSIVEVGLDTGQAIRYSGHDAAPIKIGSGAWVGRGVAVLPGVTIGAGAVIRANAVVTKDARTPAAIHSP